MRFFIMDRGEISLQSIEEAIRKTDSSYSITNRHADRESGDLYCMNEILGQIEINRSGNDLFEEEIDEFKEFLEDVTGEGKKEVLKCLKKARATVAVQVLFGDRDAEVVLKKIDPIWQWLFASRKGLCQTDGEGFYDQEGLILKLE